METAAYLALAAVLSADTVQASGVNTYCQSGYSRVRCCYRNGTYYRGRCGLSTGARIGIGVGVAVGVILLFALLGCWRRKQLAKSFKNFRPPPPGGNNLHNAPPPPTYATGGATGGGPTNSYPGGYGGYGGNSGVQSPPAAYQPSTQNNYSSGPTGGGAASEYYGTSNTNNGNVNNDYGPSYEYEQQQQLDAEKLANSGSYAAPSGPPPGAAPSYSAPSGPPPKS